MRGGMSRSGTRSGSPAWPTSRRCRTFWARCWPAGSTTSSAAASTADTWNGARISRAFASWRSAPTPSLPSPALGVPATLPEFGGRREDRPHRLPRLPPGQGDHVETLRGLRHGILRSRAASLPGQSGRPPPDRLPTPTPRTPPIAHGSPSWTLEGFRIQARTVNLDQDWRMIHEEMLEVIEIGPIQR